MSSSKAILNQAKTLIAAALTGVNVVKGVPERLPEGDVLYLYHQGFDDGKKAGQGVIKRTHLIALRLYVHLSIGDEAAEDKLLDLSDALAAQVGGIGIAPGGNANYVTGHAIFEATHGTAPKYAGLDKVNPGSLILSAEMMLRHLGWIEAADLIVASMEKAIAAKTVTYDFARLMDGATEVSCSAFGDAMIERM